MIENDEGNIGIITNERQIENLEEQTNILFKIGNKLEQRIATLEKVIGKVQLRLGDVVLYIDKKAEQHGS